MEDCLFCKIVKEDVPSHKIWEDENYFAFLDANPIGPGHTLVIPKNHTDYLFDISEEEYCGLMSAAKKIAEILKEKLRNVMFDNKNRQSVSTCFLICIILFTSNRYIP